MTPGLQNTHATGNNHPELAAFQELSTDEQLGLLWVLYEHMGESITPAAPGAAAEQFTQGLLEDIKAMERNDQLAFMRNLVEQTETEQTLMYGSYSEDNKLLFWYELAEEMAAGTVVPVPDDYELSSGAAKVFNDLAALDFNSQITVLRDVVLHMGVYQDA